MIAILRRPRRHQARRVRHPDPQDGLHEIINQGIRLHGISTWRTDRQDFESRTRQVKPLAFKRCPVPFFRVAFVRESGILHEMIGQLNFGRRAWKFMNQSMLTTGLSGYRNQLCMVRED